VKQGQVAQAEAAAQYYQGLFGENNFFLEFQNNGIPIQNTVNEGLREMSAKLSIPLVASNDCHYLDKEDARAHDVLLCVQTQRPSTTRPVSFRYQPAVFQIPEKKWRPISPRL
jgi:DNA polymerase-3 subunit alpha